MVPWSCVCMFEEIASLKLKSQLTPFRTIPKSFHQHWGGCSAWYFRKCNMNIQMNFVIHDVLERDWKIICTQINQWGLHALFLNVLKIEVTLVKWRNVWLSPLSARSQGQCSTQIQHSFWCKSWNQPQGPYRAPLGAKADRIFYFPICPMLLNAFSWL